MLIFDGLCWNCSESLEKTFMKLPARTLFDLVSFETISEGPNKSKDCDMLIKFAYLILF